MDIRTLSFAREDGIFHVAYVNLPASVHPYVCGGCVGEQLTVFVWGSDERVGPVPGTEGVVSVECRGLTKVECHSCSERERCDVGHVCP
eukprot:6221382-Prymnesium_polylepis.1